MLTKIKNLFCGGSFSSYLGKVSFFHAVMIGIIVLYPKLPYQGMMEQQEGGMNYGLRLSIWMMIYLFYFLLQIVFAYMLATKVSKPWVSIKAGVILLLVGWFGATVWSLKQTLNLLASMGAEMPGLMLAVYGAIDWIEATARQF